MDHNVLISFFAIRLLTLLIEQIISLNTVSDKINDWYTKATHSKISGIAQNRSTNEVEGPHRPSNLSHPLE